MRKQSSKADHQHQSSSKHHFVTTHKENITPSLQDSEKNLYKSWSSGNKSHRVLQNKPIGLQEDRFDRVLFPDEQEVMHRANQIVMYVFYYYKEVLVMNYST